MNFLRLPVIASFVCFVTVVTVADGIRDNDPTNVRRVPPLGIEVPADARANLERRIDEIDSSIAELKEHKDPRVRKRIPDVEIFSRAVRTTLENQEFYSKKEVTHAFELLDIARSRSQKLLKTPRDQWHWIDQKGLVVRGFRSKIDHTVQPYGLVIPDVPDAGTQRLDIWFHGRGERTNEVEFIHQRLHRQGVYAPQNTIVLHPYGRYSNAFKFAGEVDVLEALNSVQQNYAVDSNRISVRGFSMGGAGCWQFAALYSDRWFAANPGAGFSETPEFLKFFQKETLQPTWYQRKLWQWYDCNGYALNLLHCPTVAYSGELDIQKQAADIMETALAKEDIKLVHIIGPDTKHSIHPDSQLEIERRMDELAVVGRDHLPKTIDFRTYTLKYNRMHWITIDALDEHWQPTTVHASWDGTKVQITTDNVTALSVDFPAGTFQDIRTPIQIQVNNVKLTPQRPSSDRSLRVEIEKSASDWAVGKTQPDLRKRHNLQGPIDDAFMDSFIFVAPTGGSGNEPIDGWVKAELDHAITHWRQQFRGDARVKTDSEVDEDDIASANLVIFGTPSSNQLLAKLADQLPIKWDNSQVVVGEESFSAESHAPVLIYPNPLNPNRYVVLNSGFTYREYAYLNNARQVPMLPDWAIIDVRTPPTSQFPGKVVSANFFDEKWQLK